MEANAPENRSSPVTFNIAIVGGGVAGACLAVACLEQGVPFTLYESALAFGEIGAGVSFGPNARRAMEMMSPRLKEVYEKVATTNMLPESGDTWMDFRIGQHPEVSPTEDVDADLLVTLACEGGQVGMHRAQLLDELVNHIPKEQTHFNKRLLTIDDLGDDGVRLNFRDGTHAIHSGVVGCDGIKSETRKHVVGANHPAAHVSYTGKACYRGLIPMEKAVAAIGEKRAMSPTVYCGEQGHIAFYPVARGKFVNVGAFHNRDTWDHDGWVAPSTTEELLASFPGWCPSISGLLPLVQITDIWAAFDAADHPLPTYCKGVACVIGDAAHASTPHQASGAGMAIEDSLLVSRLLGKVWRESSGLDAGATRKFVEKAFVAFDATRRPRTQRVVQTSREAGQLWDYEFPGVGSDIQKIKSHAEHRMEWVWNEDLTAEIKAAETLMDRA